MKTIKFAVTVLAVAIAMFATAIEKPKMNIEPLNSDKVSVTVHNKGADGVEMSIVGENGDVMYYKYYRNPGTLVNTVFDVKHLDKGNYTMKIGINGMTLERNLTITKNDIMVGEIKETLAPYFMFNGKEIVVTQLNFEKENYKFEIYDEDGLVYQKEIGKKQIINIGFDLSQLEDGDFEIALNSAKNNFTYHLKK